MCLLDLFLGIGGGWWAIGMACTSSGGFLLGKSNAEKWGDHRKQNFFINNSAGLSMSDDDGPIEVVK